MPVYSHLMKKRQDAANRTTNEVVELFSDTETDTRDLVGHAMNADNPLQDSYISDSNNLNDYVADTTGKVDGDNIFVLGLS